MWADGGVRRVGAEKKKQEEEKRAKGDREEESGGKGRTCSPGTLKAAVERARMRFTPCAFITRMMVGKESAIGLTMYN